METLPVFLRVKGKRAAVVGGGSAAARRVETLARAGALVTVFAARLDDEFSALREATFEHAAHEPMRADLASFVVCYVATGDGDADERIFAAISGAGALINVADRPDLCDFIAPSLVHRDPLVVAISTGGASPMLGRMLKARLESTIPAAYGRLAAFMGRSRALVGARLDDGRARRRFWERVLEGPIAEMVLANNEPAAEAALAAEIEREAEGGQIARSGEVYLVGAGPGDPDLLTFRALRLMQKADVVLYDRLVGPGIVDLVRREAERIYVGKRRNDHTVPQEEIGEMLVRLAQEGKRVLRLKGGDPFIFGRGGEEIEKLADHEIPFQVCPGITAAAACSAYSGIPLTHRDHAQSCVFVTGHGKEGPIELDWNALIRPGQTVAIYMGLAHLDELAQAFVAHGADPDLPAAVVDNGARANQRVVTGTLRTIANEARAAALRGPTIIIVGTVVSLRDKLKWYAADGRGGRES
ncbi:MAG: siroheme synthase CysG [Roseiarcus sp.]|jgi:uroporphyrin-III C-methyltransferase/precorrin-2 dehydrogenase/sirohydrochlorin ferrochelatase